jgi:hypothetical protein
VYGKADKRHSREICNLGVLMGSGWQSQIRDVRWNFASSSARAAFFAAPSQRGADHVARKVDQIRAAWAAGDRVGALRIAARFFDRSVATKAFKRGMNAHNHPNFYRQLGQVPEKIVAEALAALQARFNL